MPPPSEPWNDASSPGEGDNFAAVVARRARENPDALALRFLGDGELETESITYAGLHARASALAGGLKKADAAGTPVLVAHPPGITFVASLLACWQSGAIAVPCYPPQGKRHRERFKAIAADSRAALAFAPDERSEPLAAAGIDIIQPEEDHSTPDFSYPGTCLLQYTSGSTSDPKGVRISHANLLHQVSTTRRGLQPLALKSAMSWLPPYHDMGLVLKILLSLEGGMPLTMMSPEHFIQSPLRWLKAISRYGIEFSGGPNFAFDLCVRAAASTSLEGLDLSSWKAAPCGAERIRLETLERFARIFENCGFNKDAFLPGYGLAEATLIVAARRPGAPMTVRKGLVSCGTALEDMEIRTSPEHEIQVRGPSVADGYWREDFPVAEDGWLATGDAGFIESGELFITGRIKDLLILDGLNHSPEDIERAAASASPDLAGAGGAAFAIEQGDGEQAVLIQETPSLDEQSYAGLCRAIRAEVGESCGVTLSRVLLVRQGLLPRTTSGKIRRSATRDAFLAGELRLLFNDGLFPPVESNALTAAESASFERLCEVVREATGKPSPHLTDDPAQHGLGSIEVTRVAAVLKERTGVSLPIGEFFAARSFADLARTLAAKIPEMIPARIPSRPIDEPAMLSHSQERMWFLHQLDPHSAAYHVFGALEFEGELEAAALDRAYQSILQRHEILRSRHGIEDGLPVVRINATAPGLVREETIEGEVAERLKAFARQPFDLAEDSPVRGLLLKAGSQRHVLAVCAHHIVADGWSVRLMLRELYDGYRGQPLPPEGSSYLDYAAWHRRWIEAGGADAEVGYWKERLAGAESSISLPTDFPRPSRPSSDGDAAGLRLDGELLEKIGIFAASLRTTPFTILLAAFQLFLYKHGSGAAPVIAIPVANRHHPGSGEIFGTLVNTLPYRLEIQPGESFSQLVERVRDASFAMLAAQDAPFERIIEAVQPERALDHAPLAQVMFDHQELPLAGEWPGDLSCRPLLAHRGAAQFDLSMLVFVLPGYHEIFLEYRTDLFKRETAEALLSRFLTLLEAGVRWPDSLSTQTSILTSEDQKRLRQWAHGPDIEEFLQCVPLVEILNTAEHQPAKAAVVSGEATLSYQALIAESRRIAALLHYHGVGSGDRVAVMLERTPTLPATLLGIWMAGAAYVPLDPNNPTERLAWILEDQQPLKLLASPSLENAFPSRVEVISTASSHPETAASDFPPPLPGQAAYILYTSGSTGRPKGVVVSHAALGNFLLSMQEQPGMTGADRLAAVTTISFDISTLELFLPLLTGGTIDLIPTAISRDGSALRDHLRRHPATILQATPATWRMLIDAGWQGSPALKIFCGGEAMDLSLARDLLSRGAEVWNLYGPTETTVWSTIWKLPKQPQAISIGRPIANTEILIIGPDGAPVLPSVTGELLIGGAGLAEGYWKREELTGERFIHHEGRRFYRTGDLARWNQDGTLDCLGRIDNQVKVRGFRIELGEIESAIASHPQVAEAAATVDSSTGEARLIGYYRTSSSVLTSSLHDHLRGLLPDYMIPSSLVEVDAMPLTSSGKIDRRALLATHHAETAHPESPARPPQGVIEGEVAAVWSELLNCGPVGREDDFFALGGHSLLASRMVSVLSQRLNLPVTLDALFERSTVAAFSARIGESIDPLLPRAVLLHRGPENSPRMFWMHTLVDGGMGLFPYRRAAKMLEGVTSYGIAEGEAAFSSLREMAASHLKVIRGIQPSGPYRLTGFCFGGHLAAEVAAQLGDAGEEVELLILLEASPPHSRPSLLQWLRPATWRHFIQRLRENLPRMRAFNSDTLLRRLRMKHRALAEALTNVSRSRSRIPDIAATLDLSQLTPEEAERARSHWTALHRHSPRLPQRARIVVVRADGDGWAPRSPSLGWERYTSAPLEARAVPGRHEDFLRGDSAAQVAASLSDLLS